MGRYNEFLVGLHEERTEADPPNHLEPVFVKDSNDTPQEWL
jgi:hypothetical protein